MLAILILVFSGLLIAVSASACRHHRRFTAMAVGVLSALLLWRGVDGLDWHLLVNGMVVLLAVELGAFVGAYGLQEPDDGAAA
jgi:hypothetical protein